jgi:hypothetical protein
LTSPTFAVPLSIRSRKLSISSFVTITYRLP